MMLSADSSTLRKPSEAQTSAIPPMTPSVPELLCTWRTTSRSPLERDLGERALELLDQVARLARLAGEPDERERQEEQGHEREQREVRDHCGEVRSPVGEELLDDR